MLSSLVTLLKPAPPAKWASNQKQLVTYMGKKIKVSWYLFQEQHITPKESEVTYVSTQGQKIGAKYLISSKTDFQL